MPTFRYRLIRGLVLLLISAILAGCGGDDSTPKATEVPPQPSVTPTPLFPPTWTPAPTLSPVPRVTIEYTYVPPPTGSPVFLPTRPPTEIPPTFDALAATAQAVNAMVQGGASSNTSLLLPASLLDEEADAVLAPVVGSFIDTEPDIFFETDLVVIMVDVLVRQTDAVIVRQVQIEAAANPDGDAIRLVKQKAFYTDDDTPYTDAIGDFVVGSVDTALNNVLRARYQQSNPGGGAFDVAGVRIATSGMTVRTDAVND